MNTGLTNTDVCLLPSAARISLPGPAVVSFFPPIAAQAGLEYRLDEHLCHGSCRLRHESLCRDCWQRCLEATRVGDDYLGRPRDHQRAERVLAPAELPQPLQPQHDDRVCAATLWLLTLKVYNTVGEEWRSLSRISLLQAPTRQSGMHPISQAACISTGYKPKTLCRQGSSCF